MQVIDGKVYECTHLWYDEEDNDFALRATWKFEKNYPDMPDYWHLQEVELDMEEDGLPVHIVELIKSGCQHSGSVWCDVERDGPDLVELKEVDYS